MSVCLSISLALFHLPSVLLYLSSYPPACLSIYLFVCLYSLCFYLLCMHLSIHVPFIYPYLSVCPFACVLLCVTRPPLEIWRIVPVLRWGQARFIFFLCIGLIFLLFCPCSKFLKWFLSEFLNFPSFFLPPAFVFSLFVPAFSFLFFLFSILSIAFKRQGPYLIFPRVSPYHACYSSFFSCSIFLPWLSAVSIIFSFFFSHCRALCLVPGKSYGEMFLPTLYVIYSCVCFSFFLVCYFSVVSIALFLLLSLSSVVFAQGSSIAN